MTSVLDNISGKDSASVEPIDVEAVNSRKRQSLYARRTKIFPQRADGFFRRLKWRVMAVTLAIYWLTPWLRWDRGPLAPDQAVLVDMANRRFYFFFLEIWPQEFYFVAGLLIMAGLGLFLVTSVMGRAWCGYTCPQTVWTDLFILVEQFIEGDRNARRKLDQAPWTLTKLGKRASVYALWLLIAMATGGAWIFYFADAPTLLHDFFTASAAPIAYITVAILTATTFIFAGFMREQVCTYMCPWPRIQGAMLDEDSLLVTYNAWRGEPRSRHRKKLADKSEIGDCVDCNACVAVCPMGIDIREGNQLECISCALCIDACDSVMGKVGLPKNLIGYTTLHEYNAHQTMAASEGRAMAAASQASALFSRMIRPRTLIYLGLWCLVGAIMLYALVTRDRLDVNVIADRNPLFVRLADGSVRNGFTVKILNMRPDARMILLGIDGLPQAAIYLAGTPETNATKTLETEVEPDRLKEIKIFVRQPAGAAKPGAETFRFVVRDLGRSESAFETAEFSAPPA